MPANKHEGEGGQTCVLSINECKQLEDLVKDGVR